MVCAGRLLNHAFTTFRAWPAPRAGRQLPLERLATHVVGGYQSMADVGGQLKFGLDGDRCSAKVPFTNAS